MKKIYCLALILLSLLSCVVFSACGDKYKDLDMVFYSSSGEVINEINFVIDETKSTSSQRIGIEFEGVDQDDIGQVKVYSLPNELIVDSDYAYTNNMCYVTISPVMPSSENAKLVVSHLASGKKKEIDLSIEQKSNNLNITNSKYIVSIPDEGTVNHNLSFANLINLVPVGSTDKVYFKIDGGLPSGVEAIPVDNPDLEGLFAGFSVNSEVVNSTDTTCVKIYPVTFMEGYDLDTNKYRNKVISVYFRRTLNEDNLVVASKDNISVDLNNLQLIANDDVFDSFMLNLRYDETPLIEAHNFYFFEMYQLEVISEDDQKVSVFADANNNIVVEALTYTEEAIEIKIVLRPINYVGDIKRIEKSIFVKGEVGADGIQVKKNGELILTSEKTNIFDYYEDGNSLGALFTFKPISNSGIAVHHDLNKMQIVVSSDILCEENCFGTIPDGVETSSKLYTLMFHLFNDYLEFTYDENSQKMVSEVIDQDSRVYIKYINGNPNGVESANFAISVKTLNNSELENWKALTPTDVEVNFNRLEGVKSMSLEAGWFGLVETGSDLGYTSVGSSNPEYIYLNRHDSLDEKENTVIFNFVRVEDDTVKGIDGMTIPRVDFEVEVEALSPVDNGLKIFEHTDYIGLSSQELYNIVGEDKVSFKYDVTLSSDVIGLVFRSDTSIGDYKITFYQEGIAKASVICRVYENLTGVDESYVSLEDQKALENTEYLETYVADYIVPSGRELNISIDLPQSVQDSNIVKEYVFDYAVGIDDGNEFTAANSSDQYFDKVHDDVSLNSALLKFVKGTFIAGKPQYIYLTITIKTQVYSDIVTANPILDDSNKITISFFIYEEIKEENISINHKSMTRYFERYLGVYYKENSQANLKIEMDDDLWNYVTLVDGDSFVDWRIDNVAGVTNVEDNKNKSLNIGFDYIIDIEGNSYVRVVKAYVYQFDHVFELQCVFNVEKPIISERITVQSELEIDGDENQTYYINLKNGESYQVEANNYSSRGQVTFAETIIQVTDENGSSYTARDYFDIDQTNGIITVKKVDDNHKFKLIVFAKDALQYIPSSDKSGYNNPSSFIMDFDADEKGRYLNAYFVMDIELSDGTEGTPYLIKNANEFWEIDDTDEYRSAYYRLMTSISLDNTTDKNSKIISGFKGFITTPVKEVDENGIPVSYYVYTIDGITLNNDNKNLFRGFAGEISNIKFVVNYDYNLTTNSESSLGLFDVVDVNGKLSDVSVQVSGEANFNFGGSSIHFGGLAGENNGTIVYVNVAGVTGSISLNGSANVNFGGLVGKNIGKIVGAEQEVETDSSENKIELNVSTGREKSLSQIEIISTMDGSSSIGGIVGLNSNFNGKIGTIHNAFVQAVIKAENTSNVGGVIGTNLQSSNSLSISNLNASDVATDYITSIQEILTAEIKSVAIYNVKSASTIKAKDNVGGIVGTDTNGVYIECDYQILSSSTKDPAIQANENVGGIAGKSTYGKFAYCSVMSYCWNYASLKTNADKVITDNADIYGFDYVGGIVGSAVSSSEVLAWEDGNKNPLTTLEISNRVMVVYSSVNAYLQATKHDDVSFLGNIGGILSTDATKNYKSIILNAYFIGKLEGKVNYVLQTTNNGAITHYLALDNLGQTISPTLSPLYNVVYTLNLEQKEDGTSIKLGYIQNGSMFYIDERWDTNLDYWWHNENINGGYIFITTDNESESNRLPIFDLAPDKIEVSVKEEYQKAEGLEKVLMLDYYDFSQNTDLTNEQLMKLNSAYNRNQNLLDMLNITTSPDGLGTVVIAVKSTDTNVIDITLDGKLLINGVGSCELIFSSVLNPNAGEIENRKIKVIVDYPIGSEFAISLSKTDTSKIVNDSDLISIGKDTSKQFYIVTQGQKQYDFDDNRGMQDYKYKTKDNLYLQVDVLSESDLIIEQYVSISGQTSSQTGKTLTVYLDNQTPFTISVLKKLEEENFKVKITPYIVIEKEDTHLDNDIKVFFKDNKDEQFKTEFELSTMEGATVVSFSYDDAIVYPNDTVYLTSHVVTDVKFTDETIKDIFKYINIIGNNQYIYELKEDNATFKVYTIYELSYNSSNEQIKTDVGTFKLFVDDYAKYENSIQTIKFRVEFGDIKLENEANLKVKFEVTNGNNALVDYSIIPQRINKIEIKNYYNRNVGTFDAPNYQLVLDDVLKPDYPGKMIVDIVPDNGYYSYLEISDITGDEEILFIQVDENGNALSLSYDPSSDGKGIKLYHYEGRHEKSRLFILTQIDAGYSSKIHTIEIRAYSNNGSLLFRQTKVIDVKMLPEINVDFLNPDGTTHATINSSEIAERTDLFIANGVDADFRITTENTNSDLEFTLSGDGALNYSIVQDVNNHYILKRNDENVVATDIGKKIQLTFTAYSYFDNGDIERAQCYLEFEIVAFVIHGVSVNNSIDNSDTKQIYGYFDKPVHLEFYFDKDDISFYDKNTTNEPYWDTIYKYETNIENLDYVKEDKNLQQIYLILKELNSFETDSSSADYGKSNYLILNDKNKDEHNHYTYSGEIKNITLANNNLTVSYKTDEDYSPKNLAVAFAVYYDSDSGWNIASYDSTFENEVDNYVIDKNYDLNFISATNWYEPTIVYDEDDFLEMTSGGQYLLANDLTLTNYSPLDVDLLEFDGNGRTITINSFAQFNDEEIQAGLFRQVYENMIVKNVVVEYQSVEDSAGNWTLGEFSEGNVEEYEDLCNNPSVNYTSVNFGGVAAVNNGIITNCYVKGKIAVHASTVEKKKFASGGNFEINFFVGGMVAENSSTGYITNSTSELSIYAQANIGGFVYENAGKIVSCGVEEKTTIYGYNTSLEKTIIIKVAGFVVQNSKEISMSYVNLVTGKMSAKDLSAGFVYTNTGAISDAYVQIKTIGNNNNSFSGFVYQNGLTQSSDSTESTTQNTATITRAYTYINEGSRQDSNDTMFASAGTTGLTNCVEFMIVKSGYTNGVEKGLKTLSMEFRYNKAYYEAQGFAFGDNESAVWMIESGTIPKLVSCQEKVVYSGNAEIDGLLPLYEEKDSDNEDGVDEIVHRPNLAYYGTKENPYIIHNLETWNRYITDNTNAYFRIVKDIDFASLDNPLTSTMTFKGNIQGNNMKLSDIMLYSTSSLDALGLFRKLESSNDNSVKNSIRNLTLSASSVWASKTSSVGLLAGMAEDFNLYNITIDSEGVIMVGGNAVGGLAGLVRGEFDIDQISSNIGANSTRASTLYNYSIYISRNNRKEASSNLNSVYYAGSVVGILDGYNRNSFDINAQRDINKKYYMVRNVNVSGDVTIVGDTVGGAFGLIGERVYVKNCDVNISGSLAGVQYSASMAGENRGVINNSGYKTIVADEIFAQSTNVSAGLVGLNMGGLIYNVDVQANIKKTGYGKIVGGIVGRNIEGTISNAYFDGELNAFFTGGIAGASYSGSMLSNATTGAGTLSAICKANSAYLIPNKTIGYTNGTKEINSYEYVSLSRKTFNYMVKSSKEYYSYTNVDEENPTLEKLTTKTKVLGLIVGLGYEKSVVNSIPEGCYKISLTEEVITFNVLDESQVSSSISFAIEEKDVVLKNADVGSEVKHTFTNINILSISSGKNYVMYLIGSNVTAFDSWYNSYSEEYMIVKMAEDN